MARQENNRWDMFCCIKGTKKDHANNEGMLYKLFKYLYAPFLMKKWIRASVVIIFFGWLCSSLAVIPKIEIGLDQEVSMPEDSFVLKYFKVSQSISYGVLGRGFKLDWQAYKNWVYLKVINAKSLPKTKAVFFRYMTSAKRSTQGKL